MTDTQRQEALADLALVEEALETAKGKERKQLMQEKLVLERKLWPGRCER